MMSIWINFGGVLIQSSMEVREWVSLKWGAKGAVVTKVWVTLAKPFLASAKKRGFKIPLKMRMKLMMGNRPACIYWLPLGLSLYEPQIHRGHENEDGGLHNAFYVPVSYALPLLGVPLSFFPVGLGWTGRGRATGIVVGAMGIIAHAVFGGSGCTLGVGLGMGNALIGPFAWSAGGAERGNAEEGELFEIALPDPGWRTFLLGVYLIALGYPGKGNALLGSLIALKGGSPYASGGSGMRTSANFLWIGCAY